jgi:hypothetical protein
VCARKRKRESPRINQIGLLLARVSKEYNIINPGRRALSLERAAVARISVVNLPLLLNAHFKILMGAPGASLSPLMLPKCRHFGSLQSKYRLSPSQRGIIITSLLEKEK